MSSKVRLVLLLALAPLAACATSPAQKAGLRPTVSAAEPDFGGRLDPSLASSEPSLAGLYLSGKAALADGRSDEAANFFSQAVDLVDQANRPFLKEQAFTASVLAGEVAKAASLAPGPTEGNSLNVRLGRLVTGVDAFARDDFATAYAIFKSGEVGPPFRSAGELLRPWAAAAAGDMTVALTRPDLRNSDRFTQAFGLMNFALLAESAGRTDDADRAFKAVVRDNPEIGLFRLTYGGYLERAGRSEEAVQVYKDLLAERPGDRAGEAALARATARRPAPPAPTLKQGGALALVASATVSMAQNGMDNAVTYLRLALHLDPTRTDAQLLVADWLDDRGDVDAARAMMAAIPETSPDYMGARARLALSYDGTGEKAKALEISRETVRKQPDDLDAQVLLADQLAAAEDYEEAVRVLTRVINAKGEKAEWRLYYSRAISNERAKRWNAAEKDLLTALEIQPDQPDVLNYLGYSWADRNEHLPEALDMLQRASRAKPNQGAIVDSLGWVYYRMGDYPRAVEYLEKASELTPADPDVNDHLGDAYAKLGRGLEARYQWQRVLTLNPTARQKAAVEAKLAATSQLAAAASTP